MRLSSFFSACLTELSFLFICEAKYLLLFAFVLTVYARLASLHYVEDFLS